MGGSPNKPTLPTLPKPTVAWKEDGPQPAAPVAQSSGFHNKMVHAVATAAATSAAQGAGQHRRAGLNMGKKMTGMIFSLAFNGLLGVIVKSLSIVSATASSGPYLLVIGIAVALAGLIAQTVIYYNTRDFRPTKHAKVAESLDKLAKYCTLISGLIGGIGFTISLGIVGVFILLGILVVIILMGFLIKYLSKDEQPPGEQHAGGGKRIFGGGRLNDVKREFQETLDKLSQNEQLKHKCLELLMIESHEGGITVDLLCEAIDADNFDLVACIEKIKVEIAKTIELAKTTDSLSEVSEGPGIEPILEDEQAKEIIKNGIIYLVKKGLITRLELPGIFDSVGHDIKYELEIPLLSGQDTYGGYTKKRRKTNKRRRTKRRKTRRRKTRKRTKRRKRTTRR